MYERLRNMYEKSGLIQLGKRPPLIVPHKSLYVITHPFWGFNKHPYIDNIKALIKNTEVPILTLDHVLEGSMERYTALNPKGDRFFLRNGLPYAIPDCGWETTAKIINLFEPEEVIFGGSQLDGNERDGYWHCVGLTFKNLRQLIPNPRIEESLSDIKHK